MRLIDDGQTGGRNSIKSGLMLVWFSQFIALLLSDFLYYTLCCYFMLYKLVHYALLPRDDRRFCLLTRQRGSIRISTAG
ncbi:hypothetical protein EDWATA_00626 [Edwardsiella tarda ATCC 23685]|uniref:Uncharacterized protein n=1 Tax=Edwardsiella tarda ATCC 23685 TaxID=500638 RepID=D4F1N4_EDWTA|nr:hypothetical protein EDWATA_00626 [Edwardsiella tarda ATCC 23685]